MKRLLALIIYFGLVKVNHFHGYWSTKSLYHGLWTQNVLTHDRFKVIMAMLHIADFSKESKEDKLKKVQHFIDHMCQRCRELYQPSANVAIHERMVKLKHRSGMRQYMPLKLVKFGLKLWVLAGSLNGYTYDFDIYTGKGEPLHEQGLGYTVVMKLGSPLLDQGYNFYFGNFYTSPAIINDLYQRNTPSCGTITENRKGFPDCMKGGEVWGRKKEKGDMRWEGNGYLLALQY